MRRLGFLLVLAACICAPAAQARVIEVRPGGIVWSLTEAVRVAASGDTIRVLPGHYRESGIIISSPVTIQGVGYPVLVSRDGKQILTVVADGATVEGLVLRGVDTSFSDDRAAIRVEQATGCRIIRNRFEDTYFGIYVAKSSGCLIEGNVLTASKPGQTKSGNGIHLWNAREVVIRDNRVTGHRDGIYLEFARQITVDRNTSERNLRYGLHFMFSDSCSYTANAFSDNESGVAVMYSKYVAMQKNRFEGNWGSSSFGLLLKDITDSRITDSIFRRNTVGLYAEGASRVEVARNDFLENGRAIKIMANSVGSTFTRNVFVANTFDVTTNSTQSFSTFERNYWDAYRGYDLDRDGTGDVPFYPVRLFALLVEQHEPAMILMRSLFVELLDAAERVLPTLTPKAVVDAKPIMNRRDVGT